MWGKADPEPVHQANQQPFQVEVTIENQLKKRQLDLVQLIRKYNDELDVIEKQVEWLKRFPEIEDIIRTLAKNQLR